MQKNAVAQTAGAWFTPAPDISTRWFHVFTHFDRDEGERNMYVN